jgi:rare lipoprotein A
MRRRGLAQVALSIATGFLLSACMGGQYTGQGARNLAPHPTYKIGAPYTVKGITYTPHVDLAYDETGMASWYGEAFQGQYTANGEVFDLDQITAAHRTLPLPSIVEVINLQNNRAMRVRVNDRGPFANGRILDVSRRVAERLGFERTGTTMVRVRILKDESLEAEAAAERGIVSNGSTELATVATPANIQPLPPRPAATLAAAPRIASPSAIPPAGAVAAGAPPPSRYGGPAPVVQGFAPPPQAASAHRFLVQSPLYRQEIGPVDTREEADRALEQMIQSGYRDAHIVIN